MSSQGAYFRSMTLFRRAVAPICGLIQGETFDRKRHSYLGSLPSLWQRRHRQGLPVHAQRFFAEIAAAILYGKQLALVLRHSGGTITRIRAESAKNFEWFKRTMNR